MSRVLEKFMKYVKYNTQSNEDVETCPSTIVQNEFAKVLRDELEVMGLSGIKLDSNSYLYALLLANTDKSITDIGFIAHLDTSPDMSGLGVNPKLIKNYDGKDIILNSEENIVLSVEQYPEILKYIGEELVTTDGNTLLGSDDKAGIAEIITALEYLLAHPEIEHGNIYIAFTPDEEIGRGADKFDLKTFGAELAYTIDGGVLGEIEYENFNAASMKITIKGKSIHPGYAKGKMVNSMLVAQEFMGLFPKDEIPGKTEGYEGFYHLHSIKGNMEETKITYHIRDFDKDDFEKRKVIGEEICNEINKKYGYNAVSFVMKDMYYNMKEKIDVVKRVIDIPLRAMKELDIKATVKPIRGGTDGARLSYMGIPTPNLFTGGENFHGRFEFIPVASMEKAVKLIIKIIEIYSEGGND